jgi:hypothetical protein
MPVKSVPRVRPWPWPSAPRREPEADAPQGIDAAILPPAFGTEATAANDADEAPKKPRRRRTKSDDAEVPPAA